MAGERQERRGPQLNASRDPTTRNRTTTLTEIADRFVNKFLEQPSKTALSVRIVCGPKKQFQATAVSLEKEDVEHKYGPEVCHQLYRRQKSQEKRVAAAVENLMAEKRRLVESRPRLERIHKMGEKNSTTKSSHKTDMSKSLWSLGSSTSI